MKIAPSLLSPAFLCFITLMMGQAEAKFGHRFKEFFKSWRRNGADDGDMDGPGPGHHLGRHGARIAPFILSDYKQNLTCEDEGFEEDDLTCNHPRLGMENGTWACRSIYHPVSGMQYNKTVCVDPMESYISDDCGCCEEECPAPCECPCGPEDGHMERVLVEMTITDEEDGEETIQKCIPKIFSAGLVAADDFASCVTNCN